MKFFKIVPVSLIALLAACDSSTSPNSSDNSSNNGSNNGGSNISNPSQGVLQYERHFDRDVPASLKCNVYSTNNSVSLDLKYFIIGESNSMTEKIEVKYGSPSSYNAEMGVSGLMKSAAAVACTKLKQGASDLPNAVTSCTENGAVLTAPLPDVSDADAAQILPPTVEKFKSICDESYDTFNKMTDEIAAELNLSEQPNEIAVPATSCNVQTVDNTVQMNVTFPGKTAVFKMVRNEDTYYLSEEYTGIDEATLAKVCAAYKVEEDIENVNCAGSTITYTSSAFTSNGVSLDIPSVAEFAESFECAGLLNGTLTLEDLWYND